MKNTDLSQSQLATATGISVRVIQSYECESEKSRTIDRASLENALKISTVLKCRLSDLIENPDIKKLAKKYEKRIIDESRLKEEMKQEK